MSQPPEHHRPSFSVPTADERVVERGFYESGALRYERATVRQHIRPALSPPTIPPDPLWMDAIVWVLGAFGRGLWVVGELVLGLLAGVVGLIGALVLLALGVGAAVGLVALCAWFGGRVDPQMGSMVGAAVGATVVLIIIVGALDSGRR